MISIDYKAKLIVLPESSSLIDVYVYERDLRMLSEEARCYYQAITCRSVLLNGEKLAKVTISDGWSLVYKRDIKNYEEKT